ncbi:hypothetical protein [Methylobacter sp. BBA5.1]|uniref:hypothetical protein n=1 Tax=Methylobacter sp. BBA5.1 TaxID=1495064 RepID=UPI00055A6A1A|nr:hypothetical protein [Methylobacter sp. BBA5.1]
MGVLEQLRGQVHGKQDDELDQQHIEQELAARYKDAILPKMQSIFVFMKEMVEHLTYLEQSIFIDDYSSKYPQLGRLIQTDYKINTDGIIGYVDPGKLMQINVSFFCLSEGAFSYNLQGKSLIEQEVAFLSAHKVPFEWKYFQGVGAVQNASFIVTRKIPVRFKFEVDYVASNIKILINNHENFGVYKKSFAPEQIDDDLLDEVARFMLRQDSDFIRLEISSEHRNRIRRKLEETRQEYEAWLSQIHRDEALAPQSAERRKVGKLFKALGGFKKHK